MKYIRRTIKFDDRINRIYMYTYLNRAKRRAKFQLLATYTKIMLSNQSQLKLSKVNDSIENSSSHLSPNQAMASIQHSLFMDWENFKQNQNKTDFFFIHCNSFSQIHVYANVFWSVYVFSPFVVKIVSVW